jgi:hypothetical protein
MNEIRGPGPVKLVSPLLETLGSARFRKLLTGERQNHVAALIP